jgi:uncharacterized protein YceK
MSASWVRRILPLVGCCCLLAVAGVSSGATYTYFGEDLGLGESTRLTSHPNADSARNTFLAGLTGVGTEDFESFAVGAGAPLTVNFGTAGTATLSGSGSIAQVISGTNGYGRYPISGTKYWETNTQWGISFSTAQAAFGFYGVDIGDFQGQVTLTLTGGGSASYNIPHSVPAPGGSVLYFGVIATTAAETFSSVTFSNTGSSTDWFAFDDMTIGTLQQVTDPIIPEPMTMLSALVGIGGLAGYVRRRRG